MQEVVLTTYNKLIVNYNTYEFTPSSYSNIAIDDPWFIDTSSAPDFTFDLQEQNQMILSIAEDTYNLNSHSIFIYRGHKQHDFTDTPAYNHVDLCKYVYRQMNLNENAIIPLKHFINLDTYWATYKPSGFTPNIHDESLFPYYVNPNTAALGRSQVIPRIQTITITLDNTKFTMDLPEHTVTGYWQSSSNEQIITVPAGTYTYRKYITSCWQGITNKESSPTTHNNYFSDYKYYSIFRQPGYAITFTGETFKSLFGKLHCFYPASTPYIHATTMSANSRCLHVPEGEWTADNLIAAVNSNSDDCLFTLSSDNKYIYIKSDFPFIINPVCKIITQDTDTSKTFAKQHVLLKHPQVKHFTASCQYNGQTFQSENDYTPAEFLRWIYSVTGVTCTIHKDIIHCNDTITVAENPFFEFKDDGTVNNLCGLSTMSYKAVIQNKYMLTGKYSYIDYNPIIYPYDFSSIDITDNIVTTLNSSHVIYL